MGSSVEAFHLLLLQTFKETDGVLVDTTSLRQHQWGRSIVVTVKQGDDLISNSHGGKKNNTGSEFLSGEKNSDLTKYRSLDHWRPGTVWYRHGHRGAVLCFPDNQSPADQPQTCAGGGRCPHFLGRQPGGGRCDPGCHGCLGHIRSLGASSKKAGLHQCRPAAEARWSATSR